MKTMRMAGFDKEQGRIFGIYYAENRIAGDVVNLGASTKGAEPRGSLCNAFIIIAAATAIDVVLVKILSLAKYTGPLILSIVLT